MADGAKIPALFLWLDPGPLHPLPSLFVVFEAAAISLGYQDECALCGDRCGSGNDGSSLQSLHLSVKNPVATTAQASQVIQVLHLFAAMRV
ncbi:MAG TPA: hypothetical protein VHS96_13870 [Bacteroidia bacterium]|nr:hypothetical protein [Bacteroidia bacterium]